MPLPQPILDDRSYQQLRDELVRRIPVYAPEWTDYEPSDPGVTLIELFAFLGENLLFRFNQIPESTKLQFLRLLDVPLRPAAPASGFVAFTTTTVGGALVEQRTTLRAGSTPFETKDEVDVRPLSLRAVGRLSRGAPQPGEETEFATRAWDARRRMPGVGTGEAPEYYATQVLGEDPAAPGATALDLETAVDGILWVPVLGEQAAKNALAHAILNIGYVPDEEVPSMADVDACPGLPERSVTRSVVWQASTGTIDGAKPRYVTLGHVGDTTNALSRSGVVRLELPHDPTTLDVFRPDDPDAAGTGELPPEIDAKLEEKLLFWLRAFRADGGKLGRVLWVGANAAEAEQVQQASPEFLGTGTGDAGQKATLVNRPVIPRSVGLEVEESTGWTRWQEVDTFAASAEGDRHYVLDPEAGEVRFGDGVRGLAPQIGQRIRATGYRYGGGLAGNVPPKALQKIDSSSVSGVKVSNPLPMRGGAEDEPIATAL